MNLLKVSIEASWKSALAEEFEKPYWIQLSQVLQDRAESGAIIYPSEANIFKAFELTPIHDVKVVILGQDPYHNAGEAMGLSFSVPVDKRVPPSLRNVYKELEKDVGIKIPSHGDLTSWAEQGVLLLNAMLTVEYKSPGAHKKLGWQIFTDTVIKKLSDKREGIIFLFWGRFAQSKIGLVNPLKHHILCAAHPSPLARNAFSGCKHFSKTNNYLKDQGKETIVWQI